MEEYDKHIQTNRMVKSIGEYKAIFEKELKTKANEDKDNGKDRKQEKD